MARHYFNIAFILAWLLVIAMSVFTNIYADEPAFRIYNSRHIVDGGDIVGNLYGYKCTSIEEKKLPTLLLPARLISSTFWTTFSGSRAHRLIGVAAYSFLILLVFLLTLNISKVSKIKFETLIYFTILPLTLGVSPFNLVSTRPEVFILINLFLFILLGLNNQNTALKKKSCAVIIIFLIHFFFLLHPKTLLFLPFIIFLFTYILRGFNKILISLGTIYICVVGFLAYSVHSGRLICPENQMALDMLQQINLTPRQLLSDPVVFIKSGIKNLNITKYLKHQIFSDNYQSNWLILNPNKPLVHAGRVINIFLYFSLLGLIILSAKVFIASIREKKLSHYNKGLILSLFVGILGMCFLQVAKFFYETPLFFSLVAALLLLSLVLNPETEAPKILDKYKWILRTIKGTTFVSLLFLGTNTFYRAVLSKEELGIGMPTFTHSYVSIDEGFKKIANSCQLDKAYQAGSVYTDTLGFFYSYNQPNIRIINFANALEEMDRIRENKVSLFAAPAISLYIGECKWLEKLENKMRTLDSFNISDRSFCCAVPE